MTHNTNPPLTQETGEIFDEGVLSFFLNYSSVRGRLVRLTLLPHTILQHHPYPEWVKHSLSPLIGISLLLASCFKESERVTLQIQGSGPLSLVVVDVSPEKKVRAYARFDQNAIMLDTANHFPPFPHVVGEGSLMFFVESAGDPTGKKSCYQGVVDLTGKSLEEAIEHFFQQSAQLDTCLKIASLPSSLSSSFSLGAMMIQKMPPSSLQNRASSITNSLNDHERWNEAKILFATLTAEELLDSSCSNEDLLKRLFHEHEPCVSPTLQYKFGCSCSLDKAIAMVQAFPASEQTPSDSLMKTEVACQFCGFLYAVHSPLPEAPSDPFF